MALRIRKDGRILCAAIHKEEPGDTYLDDGIHYTLSVERKLLLTEPMEKHKEHGQWWWVGNVPDNVEVETFYLKTATALLDRANDDLRQDADSATSQPKETTNEK